MNLSSDFLGSLYQGDQATKEWHVIGKGHLYLKIILCMETNKWRLEASKDKKNKVWECLVDDSFTFKLRDNFIQWSFSNSSKQKCTYGFRIKEMNSAKELTECLRYISSNSAALCTCLNITLPSKEQVSLCFKKSATMAGVLKQVSAQHGIGASVYALAGTTQSGVTPLKPQTAVGDLETAEVVFVKRHKTTSETIEKTAIEVVKRPSPSEENTVLLTVTLPNDTLFKVEVKHDITLLELLKLVCCKNNLNYSAYQFDLPIANQDKIKLKQLKISSILLIRKEGIADDEIEGTDGGGVNTPKTKLRVAPPPPKSTSVRPRVYSSPSSSPLLTKGTEPTNQKSTEDVNDFISRMLSQQAVGKSSPITHSSPSKESTRRKLNPAPAPPSSQNRLVPFPPPSHSKSGSVKRAAPPPPSSTSKEVIQHGGTNSEQVDGDEKRNYLPHGAVPLPSMAKLAGSHQNTVQLQLNNNNGDNVTPTLSQDLPPSYSPLKKPARKAPTKPPPKGSGISPQLPTGSLSHDYHRNTDDGHLISESKPVASMVSTSVLDPAPNSVPSGGPLQFKFPPPPPKSLLPKAKDVTMETPVIANHPNPSDDSSTSENEDSNSTDEQSSTAGDYDIESPGEDNYENSSSSSSTAGSISDTSDHKDDASTKQNNVFIKEDADKELSKGESESGDSSDGEEDGEGIMLISHVVTELPVQQTVADATASDNNEQLKQLDDKIMSLRNLIADTCELGGGSNTDLTIKQDSDFDLSSITSMAPPPDHQQSNNILPEAPKPPPLPPIMSTPSLPKHPPPPAPKPKPPPPAVKPKPSLNNSSSIEDELAMKLQRRQLKMNEVDSNSSGGSKLTPSSQFTSSAEVKPIIGTGQNVLGSTASSSSLVGGVEMQAQLQMLQQQMMQQQMMQLQQQFQQLQSMMAVNPSQSASLQLQQQMQQFQQLQLLQQQQLPIGTGMGPATTSLMMPGLPSVNPVMGNTPSLNIPPTSQYPMMPHQQLYGANPTSLMAPVVSQQFQVPQQQQASLQHMMGLPQIDTGGSQFSPSLSPTPSSTNPSPPATQFTSTETTISTETAEPKIAKVLSRKPSEADIRMKAMGTATDRFDNLMDEVREANPTNILKKVSVTEKEQGSTSAYTGMTAALVEAMRERRKSFQDPDKKRESVGQEWDEDQEQN